MILPTETLKKMVDDVISIERFNTVTISMMIRNDQDVNFDIDDAIIDVLSIDQNFMKNTTDNIQIEANMTVPQLKSLVTYQSGLYADIVIEYVNNTTGQVILEESPIRLKYKVFTHDLS